MSSAPRSYIVRQGDDYARVSRILYGTEREASAIRVANPGVSEPLQTGAALVIPALPDAPQNQTQAEAEAEADSVSLSINGRRFRFWESVTIRRQLDSVDTVSFTAPFEPSDRSFRDNFRPFGYQPVDVLVGGERLFTGTMLTPVPTVTAERKEVAVDCYSLPGVLLDCTPPSSAWPVEFDNLSLRKIARTLLAPFGLGVESRGSVGAVFERVEASGATNVWSFLAPLAQQRNLVMGTTPEGSLIFWRSVSAGRPVARLIEGASPLMSVVPNFNPQDYFSHVTGMEAVGMGTSGGAYTVRNSRMPSTVLRPTVFQVEDTETAGIADAVRAKTGRMFGNMVGYTVELSTWRAPSGRLWEPNTTITLDAAGAMIYGEYEFIIRSVELNRDATSKTATLELVVPGSFSGELPERLPWEE